MNQKGFVMNQPYRHAEHFVPQCKLSEASQAMPDTILFAQSDKRGITRTKRDHQKGFTLMEILVVMLVGGMIMAAGLLTMYQVIWGTARTNDQVRALTDANVATMWLKFDLQMIQETDLPDGGPSRNTLTMTWTDLTGFTGPDPVDYTIHYALNGTNLVRTFGVTGQSGVAKTIARNITSIGFTRTGDYINVSISATGPGIIGRTQSLAFGVYVKSRPEAS